MIRTIGTFHQKHTTKRVPQRQKSKKYREGGGEREIPFTNPIACFVKQCHRHISNWGTSTPAILRHKARLNYVFEQQSIRRPGGSLRAEGGQRGEKERRDRLISCFKCGTESGQGSKKMKNRNRIERLVRVRFCQPIIDFSAIIKRYLPPLLLRAFFFPHLSKLSTNDRQIYIYI